MICKWRIVEFPVSNTRFCQDFHENTEGEIVEATVGFYNFWEIFSLILSKFKGFQVILMVLAVWSCFLKRNGVEIIRKYGLEVDS